MFEPGRKVTEPTRTRKHRMSRFLGRSRTESPLMDVRHTTNSATRTELLVDEESDEVRPAAGSTPLLAFVNARSGGQQGVRVIAKLRSLLAPDNVYDLGDGGPRPGLLQFRERHGAGGFQILVCGGDGTACWVLSTLDELGWPAPYPAIAVLPLGTGNDLARTLGWGGGYEGESLRPIIEQIARAHVVQMDRWRITVQPTDSEEHGDPVDESDIDDSVLNSSSANSLAVVEPQSNQAAVSNQAASSSNQLSSPMSSSQAELGSSPQRRSSAVDERPALASSSSVTVACLEESGDRQPVDSDSSDSFDEVDERMAALEDETHRLREQLAAAEAKNAALRHIIAECYGLQRPPTAAEFDRLSADDRPTADGQTPPTAVVAEEEEEAAAVDEGTALPSPPRGLAPRVLTMNNYFSIGCDAEVALRFHELRESSPQYFRHRAVNKGWYGMMGLKTASTGHVPLQRFVELESVDAATGVRTPIPIPATLLGIMVIQIPSWAGGNDPWGWEPRKRLRKKPSRFGKPAVDDGLFEVVGLRGIFHCGTIQMGIEKGVKLGQTSELVVRTRRAIPVQIDGEPFVQAPATFRVVFHNQATYLLNSKKGRALIRPSGLPGGSSHADAEPARLSESEALHVDGVAEAQREQLAGELLAACQQLLTEAFTDGDVSVLSKQAFVARLTVAAQVLGLRQLLPTLPPDLLANVFDVNGDGSIDRHELQVVVASVAPVSCIEERLKLIFDAYDTAGSGYLPIPRIVAMLQFHHLLSRLLARSAAVRSSSEDDIPALLADRDSTLHDSSTLAFTEILENLSLVEKERAGELSRTQFLLFVIANEQLLRILSGNSRYSAKASHSPAASPAQLHKRGRNKPPRSARVQVSPIAAFAQTSSSSSASSSTSPTTPIDLAASSTSAIEKNPSFP